MAESPTETHHQVSTDRPIQSRKDDRFSRTRFAEALSQQILQSPRDDSFVVGLVGPWGSGKTSVLNLVEESLLRSKDVRVLKFNPWLFSGTEQLVTEFFSELSSQLGSQSDSKLKEAGEVLGKYCDALAPIKYIPMFGELAGQALEAGKQIGQFFEWKASKKDTSIQSKKDAVETKLKGLNFRIVVFIDDLDRLEPNEVREIMRLVRLVGDFPNITYVLAYDRERLESALDESGVKGRAYLEKIVQVTYHVPVLREAELAAFLGNEIDRVLASTEVFDSEQADLGNIFHLGIRPLFKTPRDVKRYINVLPATFQSLDKEVAAADVLALEALRVLVPDVYVQIPEAMGALTSVLESHSSNERQKKQEKEEFEKLIALAGDQKETVTRLLERVFPACKRFTANTYYGFESAQRWRLNRRVAHNDVLAFYLERTLPEGVLPAQLVQNVFDSLGNAEALEKIISDLNSKELENLFGRLEVFESKFKPESVAIALQVFLKHADRLRLGREYMYDFGADLAVGRICLRLIQRVGDEKDRSTIVAKVIPTIPTLSWQLDLIELVGYIKGGGHKLVPESDAQKFEDEIRHKILATKTSDLMKERDLNKLAMCVFRGSEEQKQQFVKNFDDDQFFIKFLARTLSTAYSSSMGDVVSKTEYYLPWVWLKEDIIGEKLMAEKLSRLKPSDTYLEAENQSLELAHKYFSGELKADRRWNGPMESNSE